MDLTNKLLVALAVVIALVSLGDLAYTRIERHHTFCAYSIICPRSHD